MKKKYDYAVISGAWGRGEVVVVFVVKDMKSSSKVLNQLESFRCSRGAVAFYVASQMPDFDRRRKVIIKAWPL